MCVHIHIVYICIYIHTHISINKLKLEHTTASVSILSNHDHHDDSRLGNQQLFFRVKLFVS